MTGTQYHRAYLEFRRKMGKFHFNGEWGTDRVKCDYCNKVAGTYKEAKQHFQMRHAYMSEVM